MPPHEQQLSHSEIARIEPPPTITALHNEFLPLNYYCTVNYIFSIIYLLL